MIYRFSMTMMLLLVTLAWFPHRAGAESLDAPPPNVAAAELQTPEQASAAARFSILRAVNGEPAQPAPAAKPIRVLPPLAVDLATGPETRVGNSMAQHFSRRGW